MNSLKQGNSARKGQKINSPGPQALVKTNSCPFPLLACKGSACGFRGGLLGGLGLFNNHKNKQTGRRLHCLA
jgi:hypothetical protein